MYAVYVEWNPEKRDLDAFLSRWTLSQDWWRDSGLAGWLIAFFFWEIRCDVMEKMVTFHVLHFTSLLFVFVHVHSVLVLPFSSSALGFYSFWASWEFWRMVFKGRSLAFVYHTSITEHRHMDNAHAPFPHVYSYFLLERSSIIWSFDPCKL